MAYDLEHPDGIGVTERAAEHGRLPSSIVHRQVLIYSGLAMLPVAIFLLMLLVARAG